MRSRYCIVCKINITYQQIIYQSKFKHNLVLTSCFFVLLLRQVFFTNRFFYCIIFPTRVSAAILQIIHASTLITAEILYICNTEFPYWYCQSMIEYHELMSICTSIHFQLAIRVREVTAVLWHVLLLCLEHMILSRNYVPFKVIIA